MSQCGLKEGGREEGRKYPLTHCLSVIVLVDTHSLTHTALTHYSELSLTVDDSESSLIVSKEEE